MSNSEILNQALWLAIDQKDKTAVVQALGMGANPNALHPYGCTTLHLWGHNWHDIEVLDILLKAGSQINARRTSDGQTALHITISSVYTEATEALIRNGADVTVSDDFGETPLHRAAYLGNERAAEELIATGKVDLNAKNRDGQTPLYKSVVYGHSQNPIAAKILAAGANPNVKANNGDTVLDEASNRKHMNVMLLLLSNGAKMGKDIQAGRVHSAGVHL